MEPLVSVIIPNYCHAQYLEERIQSVLNQTYQHMELIILDDGSEDDGASRAIIEKYRGHPLVRHIVYNEVNSGSTFKQWRRGLELAKGDYVWIAESDDCCAPTMVDSLLRPIIEHDNVVVSFCRSQCFGDKNKSKELNHLQDRLTRDFCLPGLDFIRRFLLDYNIVLNASAVLFRRDVASVVDRQFERMVGCGDWLFWIEMAEKGNVCYVNDKLNFFRRHAGCVTQNNAKKWDHLKEMGIVYNYLTKHKHMKKRKAFRWRLRLVYMVIRNRFEDKTLKRSLLQTWDPFFVCRMLFPGYFCCRVVAKTFQFILAPAKSGDYATPIPPGN